MQQLLARYSSSYQETKGKLENLPLEAARYSCVRSIYSLLIRFENFKRIIDNDIVITNTEFIKQGINGFYNNMIESFNKVYSAETKEDIIKEFDRFYFQIVLSLQGFISINDSVSYNRIRYSHMYSDTRRSSDVLENDFSEISKAYAHAIDHLSFEHHDINIFSCLGTKNVSDVFRESGLDVIIGNTYMNFKKYNPHLYIFLDQEVVFDRDAYALRYEKILNGHSSDVRMSIGFDLSVMFTNVYHDYMSLRYVDNINEGFKDRFSRVLSHTGVGGVVMLILPRVFLNETVVCHLLDRIREVKVYAQSPDSEYVVICGHRIPKADYSHLQEEMTVYYNIINKNFDTEEIQSFNIQPDKIIFKSSLPQASEILDVINKNSVFVDKINSGIIKQLIIKTEEEIKRPLLPFSPGQLGLVLVSGKIDGIVDEGNGIYHVIKGTTYKTQTPGSTVDEDGHTVNTTTYSTGTSVNMLTADGTFRTLR